MRGEDGLRPHSVVGQGVGTDHSEEFQPHSSSQHPSSLCLEKWL